jgi:nitrogen-specific signal transduction histidine kinase
MDRLFEPFFRGEVRDSRQGLGLGLHIASQIAQAHGGRIDVTSTPDETRFVFSMPLNQGNGGTSVDASGYRGIRPMRNIPGRSCKSGR